MGISFGSLEYLGHISSISQVCLRYINHISHIYILDIKSQVNLRHIISKSQEYSIYFSEISLGYLLDKFPISRVYFGNIFLIIISYVYLRSILGISWLYFRHILGIDQEYTFVIYYNVYLRNFSHIFWISLYKYQADLSLMSGLSQILHISTHFSYLRIWFPVDWTHC